MEWIRRSTAFLLVGMCLLIFASCGGPQKTDTTQTSAVATTGTSGPWQNDCKRYGDQGRLKRDAK